MRCQNLISKRKSRAKQFVNWGGILDSIPIGSTCEVAVPAHLSANQTRERLERLAGLRNWKINSFVILGHLHVERMP